MWITSSEFGTYRICEQWRFRRDCAAQSRQNLPCSLKQAVSQEEPSDRKPDPWPLWMAGHAQLKFVMTACSKTQIRLTGLRCFWRRTVFLLGPIWGRNSAPFPMQKNIFYSQLMRKICQFENFEKQWWIFFKNNLWKLNIYFNVFRPRIRSQSSPERQNSIE